MSAPQKRHLTESYSAYSRGALPAEDTVWDLQQALGSDQTAARELVRNVAHPAFGSLGMLPQPAKFQREPAATVTREPLLGEHTVEVLTALLGLAPEEIERLRAEGVV
jgi:crotonobetainyl-CoA:carnitine CoA-transferase CaiB-like acyl-CoA transferase